MVAKDDFETIFEKLRAILRPYEKKMVVVHDTDSYYYLDTPHLMKNKRRLCFAAVRAGKAYVSFYLMPVYASPELLKDLSPELKRRMQGKSCFNFKAVDDKLFKELAKLTKSGFQKFSDPEAIRKITTR
ncbi:MAG: hypothetical protein ABI698_08485 [bacterium]